MSAVAHISQIRTLKLLEEGAELLRESVCVGGVLSHGQGLIGAMVAGDAEIRGPWLTIR